MINLNSVSNIIFLDIETASQFKSHKSMHEAKRKIWSKKADSIRARDRNLINDSDASLYHKRAAINAEFGRIVCISLGFLSYDPSGWSIKLRSFHGRDETSILAEFKKLIESAAQGASFTHLAGHNIREFDIPYICRRMLANSMGLPAYFDFRQKRPWQIHKLIDTLDLWRFGDFKTYASLETLCDLLAIPSPKSRMDGSEVSDHFWTHETTESIAEYCEKDVVATIMLYLKLHNVDLDYDPRLVHV